MNRLLIDGIFDHRLEAIRACKSGCGGRTLFAQDPAMVPKQKASVGRTISSPTADLIIISDGDPDDNGFLKNAFATLTSEGKNVHKATSLAETKKLIEDAFKENGDKKISVELIGHGGPGSVKIGTERINEYPTGNMTPLTFQMMIDNFVNSIEFFSCETAKGPAGAKFLNDFAASIGRASAYDERVTAAGPWLFGLVDGYFDIDAKATKVIVVPEPSTLVLFCMSTSMLIYYRGLRRRWQRAA